MTGLWAALAPVIKLILEVLIGVFLEKANEPDTAITADRDAARRERLEQRVRDHKSNLNSTR